MTVLAPPAVTIPDSHRDLLTRRICGVLTTVGGVVRCASRESPATATPATAPIAFIIPRREICCVFMTRIFH